MPDLPELQPVKLRKLAVKPNESPLREYRIVFPSMSLVLCATYLIMPRMGIRHVSYGDALFYIVAMGVFWLYKERNHAFLAEEGLVVVKKGKATLYPWTCIQSAGSSTAAYGAISRRSFPRTCPCRRVPWGRRSAGSATRRQT